MESGEPRIIKLEESSEWKDRIVGYCYWKVYIPRCRACGKENTFFTLWATIEKARVIADNYEYQFCDKCS